jgi:hypothetical protein
MAQTKIRKIDSDRAMTHLFVGLVAISVLSGLFASLLLPH